MNKCNSEAYLLPTLCPDYAAFGKMEMDAPYIHIPLYKNLHKRLFKGKFLLILYYIYVTT